MRIVKIWIRDNASLDENERLGFDVNKPSLDLVNFQFNEKLFAGYWIDTDENDITKAKDIIFYLGGQSFSTPHTKETRSMFDELMIENR
jgi:hypothetical protein